MLLSLDGLLRTAGVAVPLFSAMTAFASCSSSSLPSVSDFLS